MKFFYLWNGFPPQESQWNRDWMVEFEPSDVRGFVRIQRGHELHVWNKRTEGRCPDASFAVDFTTASGRSWPIFSARMKRFIEDICPGDVQYLPFRLVNDPGQPKIAARTMYLGNVLTVVDCIDRRRTKVRNDDWTPRPNGTLQIRGPVCLKHSAITDKRFFRISGFPVPMVVREDIKELIDAEGFRGVAWVQEMLVSDD